MLKSLIKSDNEGVKLCNEKLWQAVIDLREELNVEQDCNISNITCDDLYHYPIKIKMYSTISNSVHNKSDEQKRNNNWFNQTGWCRKIQ